MPHTITTAITYRARLDSFNELPKEKRPPRNLWDKPWRLDQFFDEMFDSKKTTPTTKFINVNPEDVE